MTIVRSYRSKIEVLRDFLSAAREPVPKTRLIGMANLNPLSFQRYLRICTERGLIDSVSGAYVATPRAGPLLEAIDGLILKTSELELALEVLEGTTQTPGGRNGGNGRAVSPFLRQAWNEIVLRPVDPSNEHRSAAFVVHPGAFLECPAPRSASETSPGPLLESAVPATKRRAKPKGLKRQQHPARAPESQPSRGDGPAPSVLVC